MVWKLISLTFCLEQDKISEMEFKSTFSTKGGINHRKLIMTGKDFSHCELVWSGKDPG